MSEVHNSTYAPSMASTAYSDDNNDDQASQVLAEIQKLESILLEQLDKETQRFGSSSNSSIGFEKNGIVGDIASQSIGTSSDIDIDLDGASSINFSQFLDAQDSHSNVSSVAAPNSVNWSQIDAITSTSTSSSSSSRIKDFDEASDLLDNQSCTSLRKELSQVVTPYGHVSHRVQTYEELKPPNTTTAASGNAQFAIPDETETSSQAAGVYRTGAFAGTAGGSVVGSAVGSVNAAITGMSTVEDDRQSTASLPSSHASSSPSSLLSTSAARMRQSPSSNQQRHQQQNNEEQDQAELLSQTQKIKSLLQHLESQLNHVTVAASKGLQNATTYSANAAASPINNTVPSLEIRNSIRSLNCLEDSLRKRSPPFGTSSTTIEEEGEDEQSSSTTSSSAYVTHSRTRLNNIRQKLWGGANNKRQPVDRSEEDNDDFAGLQDDDVDNASVVGQVSTDIHYHHHSPIREETTCFPNTTETEQPIRPRDDYFSAAYQNAFACNSAYQLDVPEPGSAGVSSTPNDSGGKNYYYYYPPPDTGNLPNVACCKIPPIEKLLTVLKRLEVKVASCHVNHHLQKRRHRQQQQGHRFPDGAVLQQYELADLDLSNPSRAERYHDL